MKRNWSIIRVTRPSKIFTVVVGLTEVLGDPEDKMVIGALSAVVGARPVVPAAVVDTLAPL